MPARSEVLGNGTIRGEKPLRMPRGLKPLHPPLPLAGGLVGMLRTVMQVAMLTMFHIWQYLALGRTVAFPLVRNDDAGHAH